MNGTFDLIYILLLLAATACFVGYRMWSTRQARAALMQSALSVHQRDIIAAQVPLSLKLPKTLRAAFEGKINLFLDQVDFHGCDGLEVTDDMKLSIAAQASLLVVNSPAWYDNLTTILIYPGAFTSLRTERMGYVVNESRTIRTGESWSRGPVILSWEDTQMGALNSEDGHNVALHEFAHQIDDLSGYTDGAPLMNEGQSLSKWEQVILTAFARHRENISKGHKTVLDPYGATAHEEFFAVAVEAFLEKPRKLYADEPEVYAQLVELLGINPKNWRRQS